MRVNAINSYSKYHFKGTDEQPPKIQKDQSVADFVDFAKKDALNTQRAASKIVHSAQGARTNANNIKLQGQFYSQLAASLASERGLNSRFSPTDMLVATRGRNGARFYAHMDYLGAVKDIIEVEDDNSKATVSIGVNLRSPNHTYAQKVFLIEDGEVKEVQIGRTSTPEAINYKGVYFFKDGKLKTVYNNYNFNGEKGEIKGVFDFAPDGKLDIYSHKVEFNPWGKTNSGEFFFWDDNSFTFQSDDMTTSFENGKPKEYTRKLPYSKNSNIRSIKVDLENIENAPKD